MRSFAINTHINTRHYGRCLKAGDFLPFPDGIIKMNEFFYKMFYIIIHLFADNLYRPLPEKLKKLIRPGILLLNQHEPIPLRIGLDRIDTKDDVKSLVSIVTPSYNQGKFIENTIQSVLSQSYKHIQYIIQDGDSTDRTREIIEEKYINHIDHFESRNDRGQSHALNTGFKKARGEIMAWLNSDDLLLPGTVAYVAKFFYDHPDVDVVYGHRILVNEEGQEIGRWVLPPHRNEQILWNDYVPQETLFWRKSIWDKAGGYIDEGYDFAMDWELLTRFVLNGGKIVRVPRFLGAFRVHASQKSNSTIEAVGLNEMRRLRKKIHNRNVDENEIFKNTAGYIILAFFYSIGYKMRLLKF
jgi:glycosyltransferase involved in cell wall biosynthesis